MRKLFVDQSTAPKSVLRIIRHVLLECKKHGVHFKQMKFLDGSVVCTGYFNDRQDEKLISDVPIPVLALQSGLTWKKGLGILLHEYCHMQQWLEGAPVWLGLHRVRGFRAGRDACDLMDSWLEGRLRKVTAAEVEAIFGAVRAVESDCEKRTVQMIVREELPLDVLDYTRRANAYLAYYHVVQATRKWRGVGEDAPYDSASIAALAPSDHILGPSERVPSALLAALTAKYLFTSCE